MECSDILRVRGHRHVHRFGPWSCCGFHLSETGTMMDGDNAPFISVGSVYLQMALMEGANPRTHMCSSDECVFICLHTYVRQVHDWEIWQLRVGEITSSAAEQTRRTSVSRSERRMICSQERLRTNLCTGGSYYYIQLSKVRNSYKGFREMRRTVESGPDMRFFCPLIRRSLKECLTDVNCDIQVGLIKY